MPTFVNLLSKKEKTTKETVLTHCLQTHTGVWASPETHRHVVTDIEVYSKVVYIGKHEGEDIFACYEDRYINEVFLFKGIKGDEF